MKAIKIREFKKQLSSLGATFDRSSGSHEIWKLPNGKSVSVSNGHGEVSRIVMGNIRKVFKESGYDDPFK